MSRTTKPKDLVYGEYAQGWRGRSDLRALVDELHRQQESKVDFIVNSKDLSIAAIARGVSRDGEIQHEMRLFPRTAQVGEWISGDGIPIGMRALKQLGLQRLTPGIPGAFLQNLVCQRPKRAEDLLNGLMQDCAKPVFVRALDGSVRAFLSDRYRVMDHLDLALSALDVVRQTGGKIATLEV